MLACSSADSLCFQQWPFCSAYSSNFIILLLAISSAIPLEDSQPKGLQFLEQQVSVSVSQSLVGLPFRRLSTLLTVLLILYSISSSLMNQISSMSCF